MKTESEYEALRIRWRARKDGIVTQVNELWLKSAPREAKRVVGQRVNEVIIARVDAVLQDRHDHVKGLAILKKARAEGLDAGIDAAKRAAELSERVDITLPGVRRPIGAEHPVMKTWREIVSVFQKLGYSVAEGPVVETDYYNFEALNFPPNHPARDTQDTLFIAGQQSKPQRERLLLRTHTSPVQIRTMEKRQPPVRVIVPGKVYRRDNPDATHSFVFHQIEGLAVDTDITFCDFTGTIEYFVKQFFGESVKTRFRPSYFPFTEPSVEFDVSCIFCGGSGTGASGATCSKCKGSGWIELFGAGMVDPAVYGFVNYDAKKVSGFAFGMGMDRLAMLKYGIDDIQVFFQNDMRFLRQFP